MDDGLSHWVNENDLADWFDLWLGFKNGMSLFSGTDKEAKKKSWMLSICLIGYKRPSGWNPSRGVFI